MEMETLDENTGLIDEQETSFIGDDNDDVTDNYLNELPDVTTENYIAKFYIEKNDIPHLKNLYKEKLGIAITNKLNEIATNKWSFTIFAEAKLN